MIELVGLVMGKVYVIKFYYNVGGFLDDMEFGFVELFCEFFKDEVCKIGFELGLFYDMLYCYFFLGLGLGVCVFGEIKKEYCDLFCCVDVIFIEEFYVVDLY